MNDLFDSNSANMDFDIVSLGKNAPSSKQKILLQQDCYVEDFTHTCLVRVEL